MDVVEVEGRARKGGQEGSIGSPSAHLTAVSTRQELQVAGEIEVENKIIKSENLSHIFESGASRSKVLMRGTLLIIFILKCFFKS